jgi:acetyl esterase/lipase
MPRAERLIASDSPGIETGLKISSSGGCSFGDHGKILNISLEPRKRLTESAKMAKDMVKLDVWSYKDPKLQSEQLHDLNGRRQDRSTAAVRIEDRHIAMLGGAGDDVRLPKFGDENESHVLVSHRGEGSAGEWAWNKSSRSSVDLVSTSDGKHVPVLPEEADWRSKQVKLDTCELSPGGKYVLFFSPKEMNWFSYEVATGITRNITSECQASWTTFHHGELMGWDFYPAGLACWTKEDGAVLINAENDIWRVDPSGRTPGINLTLRYASGHAFAIRLAKGDNVAPVDPSGKVLVHAFDRVSMDEAFFTLVIDGTSVEMAPVMHHFGVMGLSDDGGFGATPVKALNTEAYVVLEQTAARSPNLFFTTDFKDLTPLSDCYPEKAYNWMTSELLSWKTLDGHPTKGALYKPEDFDPNKKYPVIIQYYEEMAGELNSYVSPGVSPVDINIPCYVSDGYLVLQPDIYYTLGHPGQSAFNAIVSAAQYLATKPWVDAKRIGIHGHSFGGFETNYIIAHTGIFAAAESGSGWADFVSIYNNIHYLGSGDSHQDYYEHGRERMGATLWERPDLYQENSPVLRADQVTTPLLMMANKGDGDIEWTQGIEWFTALRRLGKRTWMLQYDGQGHGTNGAAEADYATRMKQFFDHYLKGAPPPRWMTEGIPARLKGYKTGLEFDTSGREP